MTRRLPRLAASIRAATATATAAPADAARPGGVSDTAATTVAEIVTFRLIAGTSPAAFRALAEATGPAVARQPGFLGRTLSVGSDGLWTDHVEWTDMAAATAATTAVMSDPAFAPFAGAIDPATVTMRHDTVAWTQGR